MKIVKIKFLGSEYDIRCEDSEVGKIKNLEAKLKNRVNQYSKQNYNFTDTHKLLIVSLSLEDQINDLLTNKKNLNESLKILKEEYNKVLQNNDENYNDLKKSLELISTKIKSILKKIQKENSE